MTVSQVAPRLGIIVLAMTVAGFVGASPASAIIKAFIYVLLLAYVGCAFVKEESQ